MSSSVRAPEIKPLPPLERGAARVSPVLKALIILVSTVAGAALGFLVGSMTGIGFLPGLIGGAVIGAGLGFAATFLPCLDRRPGISGRKLESSTPDRI